MEFDEPKKINLMELNDNVLDYMLSFFEFDKLFGTINFINNKFHSLAIQLEEHQLTRKIIFQNFVNKNVSIVTKQRAFRLPIENDKGWQGPYNTIHDAIFDVGGDGLILIVEDGIYTVDLQPRNY